MWKQFINNASGIHGKNANDLAHFGGILRCKRCGKEQSLSTDQIAEYLATGWPMCCNESMLWVTQRQLDEEAE